MKMLFTLMLLCLTFPQVEAQRISRTYKDVSLSEVLRDLNDKSTRYEISFIYNDLEDFRVTADIYQKTIPEAVQQVVGFYPMRVIVGDSLITVECTHKTDRHLSGHIIDEHGKPIAYANVALLNPTDSTLISCGVSNESGVFVIPTEKFPVLARISFIGYKTILRKFYSEDAGMIQILPDAIGLGEVIVERSNMVHGSEKSAYFPTKPQMKGTNNGLGLLYNMMIPELRVDRRNGSVKTSDNKTVTQCINGIPASITEIKGIRPKDIIRIDFYPVPTGKFARYDAVIDYIVKNADHGGYYDIKTATTVINTAGDYNVVMKYSTKKWVHNLMGGFNFTEDKKGGNSSDEWIGLSPDFEKTSLNNKHRLESFNEYIHWGLSNNDEKLQISIKTGFLGNNTPHNDNENTVCYTPEVYASSSSVTNTKSKSIGAYLEEYVKWAINKKQYIILDGWYQYGHNDYNRQMTENTYTSNLITKEDNHEYYGGLTYSLSIGKSGNLTAQLYDMGKIFKDKYRGDTESNQSLINNFVVGSLSYRHNFSKKLYAQIDLTEQYIFSKINDTKENTWLFLPSFYISYKTSEKGRLVFNINAGYVSPPIEWKSDTYINVNEYEQTKGNKDLRHYSAFLPSLSYSHNFKNLAMNISYFAFMSRHSVQDYYLIENEKLIHTYSMGSSYIYNALEYKLTSYLLKRHLQTSVAIGYDISRTNDEQQKIWQKVRYSLDVLYNTGNFTFSGCYSSKRMGIMWSTGSSYYDIPYKYNLSAAYSFGNWYASIDLNNIFSSKQYGTEYMRSSVYTRTAHIISLDYFPSITFKLSCNFNFGRKKVERKDEYFDRKISTGFLKPQE